MTFDHISTLSVPKHFVTKCICIIFIFFLPSCNPEKKIARQFIDKKNTVSVLFLKPDVIYKTNYKVKEISLFDSLPAILKDSVWKANTLFLDSISDSLFINHFSQSLMNRIRSLGLKTYLQDSMEAFLSSNGIKFIVNYSQCEIEEYMDIKKFEFAFEVEGRNTDRELLVNSVNLNNWFDISMLNTGHTKDIEFSSQTISDLIDGKFVYYYLSGDVDFDYTYYPISAKDVTNASVESGRINAGYLFDYFMNTYIAENLKDKAPSEYYHYRGYKRKIKATQDRFVPLN